MEAITGKHARFTLMVIAVIAFFLPFIRISCMDVNFTASGYEMAVGADVPVEFKGTEMPTDDPDADSKAGREVSAILWGIVLLLGLFVSFIRGNGARVTQIILSLLGVIFIFLLQASIKAQLTESAMQDEPNIALYLDKEYLAGFWISIIVLPVSILQNILKFIPFDQSQRGGVRQVAPVRQPLARICSYCGAHGPEHSNFCTECGAQYVNPPVAVPMMNQPVQCSGCGAQAPPGSMFCAGCGAPLPPLQPVMRPRDRQCAMCDYMNPSGSKYCGNCGTLLQG